MPDLKTTEITENVIAPVGRGMTRPTCILPWVEPLPFVLRDPDTGEEVGRYSGLTGGPLLTSTRYKFRKELTVINYKSVSVRIKRGPGKGQVKCIKWERSRKYTAYYGIRP